jgi:ankyrin repeat protein
MDAAVVQAHEFIQLLYENGCDPHYMNVKGETALSIACSVRATEVVRELLRFIVRVDVESDGQWPSAIHWACHSGNPEIVEMILGFGCDLYRLDRDNVSFDLTENGSRLLARSRFRIGHKHLSSVATIWI